MYCAYCGTETDDLVDVVIIGSKIKVCKECATGKIVTCPTCKNFVSKSSIITYTPWSKTKGRRLSERSRCPSCISASTAYAHLRRCCLCGKTKVDTRYSDSGRYIDGEGHVCSECIAELFFTCSACGGLYRNTYRRETESRAVICEECMSPSLDRVLLGYSHKPKPYFRIGNNEAPHLAMVGPLLDDGRHLFMGFELEIDGGNDGGRLVQSLSKTFDGFLYFKRDGSLSDRGIEIVSHPATLGYLRMAGLDRMFESINHHSYRDGLPDFKCGLHVHVNRKFFGVGVKSSAMKLAWFMHKNPSNIKAVARRNPASHCFQIKRIDYVSRLWSLANITGGYDAPERYDIVNFTNQNTIEFRMFKSTTDYETFMSCLTFVDAICRFVKITPVTKCIKNRGAWALFEKFVDGQKEYKNLAKYINRVKGGNSSNE